jgi:hypothetical protein
VREHSVQMTQPGSGGNLSALTAADSVGDRVPACARGTVHSVFAHAFNIETATGELVTLLAPELGATPHGIRLAVPAARFDAWLHAGEEAILRDAVLRLPQVGVAVDLAAAAIWHGTVAGIALETRSSATEARLRELRAIVSERAPRQGIAAAFRHGASHATFLERAFIARLAHTLPTFARATDRRDVDAIVEVAARLVGLGPGLTPAGDDFLTGYLAALRSRVGSGAWRDASLAALAAALVPLFVRTNAISRQMLDDAAHGRFAQSLVDVTLALSGAGNINAAAARALACGHSSGADALCGLLFGYAPGLLEMQFDAGRIAAAA